MASISKQGKYNQINTPLNRSLNEIFGGDSKMNDSDLEEQTSSSSSDMTGDSEYSEDEEMDISKNDQLRKEKLDFQLSCLHHQEEEALESSFKTYLEDTVDKNLESGPVLPLQGFSKDFTPWWVEFTKSHKYGTAATKGSVLKNKGNDSYCSWFSKSPENGTHWLCGPCPPSSSASLEKKSNVEDIEVPSIYDKKPPPKGRRALKKERKAEKEKTLGAKWFGMKAPDVDDQLRNDMEIIRMRGVLDPKRFYKNHDRKALPKYFQMGTVMDEGTEFYSSRLTKKQRKQTLVQELMADVNIRQYNKRKYAELQQKMRGKQRSKPRPKKT
ncbi:unnamed protein product [Lymnaea stagnalis]|uniref:Fcf2 pre-rRNA processing C-terminal domain-containing protein n=1 Tax=Lymnaea stagnalis TaxID=6523 RepID=A0AAV2I0B2_LYMST